MLKHEFEGVNMFQHFRSNRCSRSCGRKPTCPTWWSNTHHIK